MSKASFIRNLPLLLGIVLPLAFVVVVMLMAYVPGLSVRPAHDFVYTQATDTMYQTAYRSEYQIVDGSIELRAVEVNESDRMGLVIEDAPRLFLYDIEEDTSREITLADAKALNLVAGPSSPDGYIVDYKYGGSFGLFGGDGNSAGFFISKDGAGKRLPALSANGYWQERNLRVIGWVQ